MKCYTHPTKEAVGVCTVCGRAICKECSDLVKNKLYCRSCMKDIVEDKLSKGHSRGKKPRSELPQGVSLVSFIMILEGLLSFLSALFFFLMTLKDPTNLLYAVLVVFLIGLGTAYLRSSRSLQLGERNGYITSLLLTFPMILPFVYLLTIGDYFRDSEK